MLDGKCYDRKIWGAKGGREACSDMGMQEGFPVAGESEPRGILMVKDLN